MTATAPCPHCSAPVRAGAPACAYCGQATGAGLPLAFLLREPDPATRVARSQALAVFCAALAVFMVAVLTVWWLVWYRSLLIALQGI